MLENAARLRSAGRWCRTDHTHRTINLLRHRIADSLAAQSRTYGRLAASLVSDHTIGGHLALASAAPRRLEMITGYDSLNRREIGTFICCRPVFRPGCSPYRFCIVVPHPSP